MRNSQKKLSKFKGHDQEPLQSDTTSYPKQQNFEPTEIKLRSSSIDYVYEKGWAFTFDDKMDWCACNESHTRQSGGLCFYLFIDVATLQFLSQVPSLKKIVKLTNT